MARLATGDAFPQITVDSPGGQVDLGARWREGPIVLTFMRHFG